MCILSIVLTATAWTGVCGTYAPPANVNPHLRQLQMPVPRRRTATVSQRSQRWRLRETFSISLTRFLMNRPYRGPKRPALPVTFPFALCFFERAMVLCLGMQSLYIGARG